MQPPSNTTPQTQRVKLSRPPKTQRIPHNFGTPKASISPPPLIKLALTLEKDTGLSTRDIDLLIVIPDPIPCYVGCISRRIPRDNSLSSNPFSSSLDIGWRQWRARGCGWSGDSCREGREEGGLRQEREGGRGGGMHDLV